MKVYLNHQHIKYLIDSIVLWIKKIFFLLFYFFHSIPINIRSTFHEFWYFTILDFNWIDTMPDIHFSMYISWWILPKSMTFSTLDNRQFLENISKIDREEKNEIFEQTCANMLFTNGSSENNITRPIIKVIQLITKNTEHLRFVRHGLNDVIVNSLSTKSKSFFTKMNRRIFYLKKRMMVI
jgi:hypothetical protein